MENTRRDKETEPRVELGSSLEETLKSWGLIKVGASLAGGLPNFHRTPMKWLVEVKNMEGDREILERTLGGLGFSLVEEHQGRSLSEVFLSSPEFETLDSHGEVWRHAQLIASIISELHGLAYVGNAFELGSCVYEILPDGGRRKHAFGSVTGTATGFATVRGHAIKGKELSPDEIEVLEKEKDRQRKETAVEKAKMYIGLAREAPKVLEVLRLTKEEQSPDNLGRIFELIKDDVGDDIGKLVSKKQITRFTRSINNPAVFGMKARHSVSKQEPPPDPMTLLEAQSFVTELVQSWLRQMAEKLGYI